jgi:hypothetical protein
MNHFVGQKAHHFGFRDRLAVGVAHFARPIDEFLLL